MRVLALRQIDTWPIPFRLDWTREEVESLTLGELLELLAERAEAAGRRVDPIEEARRVDVAVHNVDRAWFLEVEGPRIRAWAGTEERQAFEQAEPMSSREASLSVLGGPGPRRADLVRFARDALARPDFAWWLVSMVDRYGRGRPSPSGQWWPRY